MLKSILAGLALVSMATPALAQDENKDAEGQKLYQTTLECAGAALAMPFLKSNLSKAEQDALTAKAEFWLGLAIAIGKTVGADVSKDSEASAFRMIAQMDLVGNAPTLAFYTEVQKSCDAIYAELSKS